MPRQPIRLIGAEILGVAEQLNGFDLAYLHVIDPRIKGDSTLHEGRGAVAAAFIRKHYTGRLSRPAVSTERKEAIVDRGDADFVAFARWFSSNPDLPERLRHGSPLTPYKREAFWGGDERGYSDFLPYQEDAATPSNATGERLAYAACHVRSAVCAVPPIRCRVLRNRGTVCLVS